LEVSKLKDLVRVLKIIFEDWKGWKKIDKIRKDWWDCN